MEVGPAPTNARDGSGMKDSVDAGYSSIHGAGIAQVPSTCSTPRSARNG